ncbi:MAG: HAMP domain-containing protein [Gammaproteobacteria bacterium]|nr:HAMP domain-containing protein [Gammaproteobacteria bacterium]MCG3146339.1 Adaptive-response sensory-kinase SasA [Gammaproteobacteria bacterium]
MRTLRLRTRLMAGFAVMAALVVAFAVYTLLQEGRMRAQVQYLAGRQADVQNRLQDLRETLSAMQQNALQGALNRDRKLLLYATTQAAVLFEVFDELRLLAERDLSGEDRVALLAFLDRTENLYRQTIPGSFITLGDMVGGAVPERHELDRLRLDGVQLNSAFASFLVQARGETAIRLQEFDEGVARLRTISVAAAASAVLAMGVFFVLMQRDLSRPLRRLESFVAEIREPTPTSRRLDVERNDEIGAVAAALNRMLDRLRETAISRDHFNHVIASLSNALIVVDRHGAIDTANAAACAAFGRREDELLRRGASEVLPPAVSALMGEDGGDGEVETELTVGDGERTPMLFSAARLPEREGGWVIAGTDITARKKAEGEIRLALDRQLELNDIRTRFVSMTSHEFRTPLATIQSSAELIRDYSERLAPEERSDLINSITTAVKRMTGMLEDVLLIGRADSGRIAFRPVPVQVESFCCLVAEEASRAAARDGRQSPRLRVSAKSQGTVASLDEGLIGYMIGNLVSNACKYSSAGDDVELTIDCSGDAIRIVVEDHGIGIPAEHLPHLYEPFRRAANVGGIHGTGLGLAIVRRSVELHRGRIEVDSQVGRGTRFVVTLPIR